MPSVESMRRSASSPHHGRICGLNKDLPPSASRGHQRAIDEVIRQLRATHASAAEPHWRSASFIGFCAQVPAAEGRLLEHVLRERVSSEPGLKLMEPGIALPILPDAERMLARNEWTALTSLSVDPDQRTTRHYRPDLIVIGKDDGRAILIDVKRSLHSYSGSRQLNGLKDRMLAAALVAPEILYREHKRTMVTRTEVAIIDLAESRKSYGDGVYALPHLDQLLGIEGLAADLGRCRSDYRVAVDQLIGELASEMVAPRSFSGVPDHRITGKADPGFDPLDDAMSDEEDMLTRPDKCGPRRSNISERIRVAPVGLASIASG